MDGRAYYKLSDGKLIGVSNRTDRSDFTSKQHYPDLRKCKPGLLEYINGKSIFLSQPNRFDQGFYTLWLLQYAGSGLSQNPPDRQ